MSEGQDLHSINASKILAKEWNKKALPDCEFAKTQQRCKCPEHQVLRSHSKQLSFG